MQNEDKIQIELDQVIKDVTDLRDFVLSIRNKMNKGEELEVNWEQKLAISYETIVRPYAKILKMNEPGKVNRDGYTVTFENPVEFAAKEPRFPNLHAAITYLNRLIGRLELYKSNPNLYAKAFEQSHIESALARVQQAMRMFHTSAAILADRRKEHQEIVIQDEYDVRDILYCILKPQFRDTDREDWCPPVGKQAKKIDLVIPSAQIVIELKIVHEKGKTNQIVSELKDDIESYHAHPACGTLICFIYNPELAIEEPHKIIDGLSGTRVKMDHVFEVIVEIYPK